MYLLIIFVNSEITKFFVTWQKLHILLKISSQWKGNLVVASYVEIGERGIVSPYLKFFAPKVAFLPR